MSEQFEGSARQRLIGKLREVEEPLERIRLTASLLIRCAHDEDLDAAHAILEDAQAALARMDAIER